MGQTSQWRMIFLLLGILVVTVLTEIAVKYKIDKIHHSFTSIYSDRLLPASEIYYISEHLYEKRLLLEEHFFNFHHQPESLHDHIGELNISIDSLIMKYEQSYFVTEECTYMELFKEQNSAYTGIEHQSMKLMAGQDFAEARHLFETKGLSAFDEVVTTLHRLARIQTTVGLELMNSSNADFASATLLFYLRIASVVVIVLIILLVIRSSTLIHTVTNQKLHLN